MRTGTIALALCCALVAGCDSGRTGAPRTFDHAADPMPFPRPALVAPEALVDAPPLSEAAKKRLDLRRSFFARDFVKLDAAVHEANDRYLRGEAPKNEARILEGTLDDSQLAGIDACQDWLAAMPQSHAAHWLCGALWQKGALEARGGEFAHKVPPVRFALMRERLLRSNTLLEKAITLSPQPLDALTLLAENQFLLGNAQAFSQLLDRAEQIMPGDPRAYEARIIYSLPQWGGSPEAVRTVIERATKAGVASEWLLNFHDRFVAVPEKVGTPGAEKAYWERVIAEKPTYNRLRYFAGSLQHVQNWRDSLPIASRVVEQFPDSAQGYTLRAAANEKLGHTAAALDDYRMAAALGDNGAIQTLVQAHIQGALGLPAKNWPALDELCRYGAALGSAAAANCLGSTFLEGNGLGPPFRTDMAQAFAWHLFAARGGYHNSQYDLGWLTLKGRAPGVKPEQAKAQGLFWLRRAAEQDHQFAKKKLEEGGHSESEVVAQGNSDTFYRIASVLLRIWRFIL